jgi:glycosyltransferase involved in cell wall biosynthesis
MSKEKQISLCITTFNRFEFTIESFAQVINDGRISEVVISDDCSTDGSIEKLRQHFLYHPKIKLFSNLVNVGVYHNKKRAIELASNPWCILFDSDNIISEKYIDTIFNIPKWEENVAYCPDFAKDQLDYQHFAGVKITNQNAGNYIDQRNGGSLFNTLNYFCNRDFFLKIYDSTANPIAADSIMYNFLYLKNGGAMEVIKGLQYYHRIHPNSYYVQNTHRSDIFHKEITDKIREMK